MPFSRASAALAMKSDPSKQSAIESWLADAGRQQRTPPQPPRPRARIRFMVHLARNPLRFHPTRAIAAHATLAVARICRSRARRVTIARHAPILTNPLHMARKRAAHPAGSVVVVEHTSRVLADNPLGDPHVRKLARVAAAGLRRGHGARPQQRARPPLSRAVRPRRLHGVGARPRQLAARSTRTFPSARRGSSPSGGWDRRSSCSRTASRASAATSTSTRPPIGRYADYLTRELIPFVDREFRTLASRDHRGVLRQVVGRLRRDHPRHAVPGDTGARSADHSGDAYFEWCYLPDWPRTLNELARYRRPALRAGQADRTRGASARRTAATTAASDVS